MRDFLFTFAFFYGFLAYAQEPHSVIGSAGESVSGAGLTLDYVIGELAVQELNSSDGTIQQGFLQSKNIILSTVSRGELLELGLFPNPNTTGRIQIATAHQVIRVEVSDVLGNQETFHQNQLLIDTQLKGLLVVKVWTTHGVAFQKIEVL